MIYDGYSFIEPQLDILDVYIRLLIFGTLYKKCEQIWEISVVLYCKTTGWGEYRIVVCVRVHMVLLTEVLLDIMVLLFHFKLLHHNSMRELPMAAGIIF